MRPLVRILADQFEVVAREIDQRPVEPRARGARDRKDCRRRPVTEAACQVSCIVKMLRRSRVRSNTRRRLSSASTAAVAAVVSAFATWNMARASSTAVGGST
jgi:hypothetical protein